MGSGAALRRRSRSLLQGGQEIVVRVTRDPMGGKGPRLSTQLLYVGRRLLYSPVARMSGASRRLEDGERERLRSVCAALGLERGGVVARTAAEGTEAAALERELRFLRHLGWPGGLPRRLCGCAGTCVQGGRTGVAGRAGPHGGRLRRSACGRRTTSDVDWPTTCVRSPPSPVAA